MSTKSNRQILTRGKNYATKQAKKFGADEVSFNKDSRLDYLTGFHKRKLERKKKAQEFNKEQDRLAKIEARKKAKEEKKKQMDEDMRRFRESLQIQQDIEENVNEGDGDASDSSWHGFDDEAEGKSCQGDASSETDSVKPILKRNLTAVYDNETTVEIETLEPNENFEYLAQINNVKLEKAEDVLNESVTRAKKYAKFLGMADADEDNKKKKKQKKFRYLTKNERKDNQRKAYNNKHRR
ncbi:rRNA-processing protein RRP17 KNAG_0C04440 [Huiozyma naganishii CBS 8797]|uniref:Ribosomal RNA-processing protein 17 n=1 Tax=Huiozyma naganishii (strain ATCC MYA-139 / BCRC 22969 / CBS 8797 / KCTC 17520 / NBRC 10181 / NCYC 3082 / Yp74L-3) TaxID=1071383 RepID=J7S658_HUIN7|nr:hypothetical protein KNAG_0C04440 [Kazachstania naganishii CBS 8797]CCK69546.1 hypothetical protein KNAG_0C04440 [Kazachstania naganishii CBS 8797]